MTRTPLIAGNWKMHKLAREATAFVDRLSPALRETHGVEIILFPSYPLLPQLAENLGDDSVIELGGQDLHCDREGAHTGDTSGEQLVDCGCRWVLCGHSERRSDHGEHDVLVAGKVAAAERAGLRPVVCIGESLAEREQGGTETVLARQLDAVAECTVGQGARAVIAYEPVWAIGTGKSATPEIAQSAHAFLRRRLSEIGAAAEEVRLLYGGSVKPSNCADLIAQTDIDGFLIGGASLDPDSFLDIIRRCTSIATIN